MSIDSRLTKQLCCGWKVFKFFVVTSDETSSNDIKTTDMDLFLDSVQMFIILMKTWCAYTHTPNITDHCSISNPAVLWRKSSFYIQQVLCQSVCPASLQKYKPNLQSPFGNKDSIWPQPDMCPDVESLLYSVTDNFLSKCIRALILKMQNSNVDSIWVVFKLVVDNLISKISEQFIRYSIPLNLKIEQIKTQNNHRINHE